MSEQFNQQKNHSSNHQSEISTYVPLPFNVSYKREFIAGLTTFLTMSYIIVVNPSILSTPGTGLPFQAVLTATVMLSFLCTMLMGVWANLPYAIAPGMGLNAYFTYSLILGQKVPWQTALGALFWSGILFFIFSVTPIRSYIIKSIPMTVRLGAAAGIGIFLTFIGLKNALWIEAHPVTIVTFSHWNWSSLLALLGFFIGAILWLRKNPAAFLISILVVTVCSLFLGLTHLPDHYFDWPDFKTLFFQLDLWGSFHLSLLPAIMSVMLTDLFDSLSSIVGLSKTSGLVDANGDPKNLKQALIVDSFATGLAGIFGTSSGTAFIESASGIEVGGRTGWTAIFCALFFLPFFFLAPILQVIPGYATASVLVLVGFMMFSQSKEIFNLKKEDALCAFISLIIIPLTFSITQGLVWGMVFHVIIYFFSGRRKELSLGNYIVASVGIGLILIQNNVFQF